MSLITSVDRITRTLQDIEDSSTLKEQKQFENTELKKDIRDCCNTILFDRILCDNNYKEIIYSLDGLDELISEVLEEIKSKKVNRTFSVIKNDVYVNETRYVNKYNINNDYELELIIRDIFDSELSKVLKRKKELDKEEESRLKYKLKEKFNYFLRLDSDVLGLINQLSRQEIKDELIEEITTDSYDIEVLNRIYYKTLDSMKREFKYEIDRYKQQQKIEQERLKRKDKNRYNGVVLFGVLKALNSSTKKLR